MQYLLFLLSLASATQLKAMYINGLDVVQDGEVEGDVSSVASSAYVIETTTVSQNVATAYVSVLAATTTAGLLVSADVVSTKTTSDDYYYATSSTTDTTESTTASATSTYVASSTSSYSTTSTSSTSSTESSLGTFEQSMLDQHNAKRALHKDTSLLSWSTTLEDVAQAYADAYDCSGTLVHSGKPYGENLALGYPLYDGNTAIDAWYNEISDYDFSNPGFSESTGHFTQVVWKDTTQVGCGYKACNNAWGDYLVCNYLAEGNVIGEFASEVEELI